MRHTLPNRHRRAITLIEVLLVLAVLVMLAAMTWPALGEPMASQRLLKAADRIRTEWAKARVGAMRTGQTYIFRYTVDDSSFTIEAQAGPEAVDLLSSSTTGVFDEFATDATMATEATEQAKGNLPENIKFISAEVAFDTRSSSLGTTDDGTVLTATDATETISDGTEPILFFPDGTTSTAKLTLENEYQRRVDVSLRGLTGMMTVGDSYSSEDMLYGATNQ